MTRPALTRCAGKTTTMNTSAPALAVEPVSTVARQQAPRGARIGAQPATWSASTESQRNWKTWWIMTDPMTAAEEREHIYTDYPEGNIHE